MTEIQFIPNICSVMKSLCTILVLFGLLEFTNGSLIDYIACQRKFNCTENLSPADCPPGKFLDTQLTNGCCHGCRSGIGWEY